ncbi:unnamed protein product [Rhizoctonia solani]|uniref:DUF6535 domain-containing protein n=1 Tax=Rhizoctonia solani TaxID=456999 RepID=A0A8H3DUF9_9AGAM|nr:unnamed protein product [Rhizoctonia solani]
MSLLFPKSNCGFQSESTLSSEDPTQISPDANAHIAGSGILVADAQENVVNYQPPPSSKPERAESPNDKASPGRNDPQETPTRVPITEIPNQSKEKAKNDASKGVPKGAEDSNEITPDEQEVEDMKTNLTASKSALIWDKYLKLSEPGDKAVLADLEGTIDVTLVKAALFSAISTGFLLESSKSLLPEPNFATVLAIRELTAVVQAGLQVPTNSSLPPEGATTVANSFKPSMTIIWVNCLWFLSLGLSISVSLFAMLAKRLCYKARLTYWGTPYERSVRRQEVWEALEKWKFEFLVEQLSMLMHIALILFFIGLVLFLSELSERAMIITAIPIGLATLSYLVLTMLPLLVETFPIVTPFSRYIQSSGAVVLRLLRVRPNFAGCFVFVYARRLTSAIREMVQGIKSYVGRCLPPNERDDIESQFEPSTSATAPSEEWVIQGFHHPPGTISCHPTPETQRYAFRALVWLLQHSNNKSLIGEVLDYVNSYPEVVLDSGADSRALYEATLAVARHIRRLQHDPVEWHGLNTTHFRAKCGRFIYLSARPWLHSIDSSHRKLAQTVYKFCCQHSPDMSAKEVEDQIKELKAKKDFPMVNCIPWLERQAVKITLGCPPEAGLAMCKALFEFVGPKVDPEAGRADPEAKQDHAEEVFSTLSWTLLNTLIDANNSHPRPFWPIDIWNVPSSSEPQNDSKPKPMANFDSTLTLSYFRHSETRKKSAQWLKTVGLSGILYTITYYPCDDLEPHLASNSNYYTSIIEHLRVTLSRAAEFPTRDEDDPYFGMLPVYWESQICRFEFDSLHYCFDALNRASEYSGFLGLRDKLQELKDMIPEGRRGRVATNHSKSEFDADEPPMPSLLRCDGARND